MSTATRPRGARRATPAAARARGDGAAAMSADERLARIKTIHQATARKASRMMKDETANRSTASQRAQREKARGFEEIGRALAGKP